VKERQQVKIKLKTFLFSYYKTKKDKTNTELKTILCQTHVVSMYPIIKVISPNSTWEWKFTVRTQFWDLCD